MNADQFWEHIQDSTLAPVVLPDIGTFFNQDLERAEQLLRQIAATGTQFIKGEILHNADICLSSDQQETFLNNKGEKNSENYRALIERKTISLDDYAKLFEPCKTLGLGLVLSVYDNQGANFAKGIGACALKIASTNIVHAPLIRHCANLGLPLLIDTGKATLDETKRALSWAQHAGAERIIIEYSPPAPPAPVNNHNLTILSWLANELGIPIGLSDHHHGEEMFYAATTLGCRVLEKGVCPDDQQADQDVFHALPVGQLKSVMDKCQTIHDALGTPSNAYQTPPTRPAARMGLISAVDLKAGDKLLEGNVSYAFPTLGIAVENWDEVEGKSVQKAIAKGQPIEWDDVAT